MRLLRAIARLLRGVAHVLGGLMTLTFRFPRMPREQRELTVQVWAARMLAIMGVTVDVRGQPPLQGPMLLVSNHISWLDIVVMHAARHCRFVSKAAVRRWPLVGPLATGAGTLYIERASSRDALRVVHQMVDSLKAGDIVAVFPEGTTGDGRTTLPFHGNLIQAAISAGVPVQPVALRFIDSDTGDTSFAPSYIGDETLVGSIWRTISAPGITAVVRYGEPQQANGRDRRTWAKDLREEVLRLRG